MTCFLTCRLDESIVPGSCSKDGFANDEKRATKQPCRQEGSLTVEAALSVPLFLAAITALMFLLNAMKLQINMQMALYNQIHKASGYAYYLGETELSATAASFIEAEAVKLAIISELGEEYLENSGIVGGAGGIFLNISNGLREDQIDVALEYRLALPYDLLGIGKLTLITRACCRKWTGTTEELEEPEITMVYVTATGTVYHVSRDCAYIRVVYDSCDFSEIGTLRNQNGARYYPCQYCVDEGEIYETVYYTRYGTRYHVGIRCPNIHRNVFAIELERAKEDYPACSRCGQ